MSKKQWYYRLTEDKQVVPCTVLEWGEQFGSDIRIVKQETVGDFYISTVFLGLDHNYGDGPPHLFETMVNDSIVARYSTWDEAKTKHDIIAGVASEKSGPKFLQWLRRDRDG